MDPVTREILTVVGATALREFVLVVRKDQVLAASVNVDRIAEMLLCHC